MTDPISPAEAAAANAIDANLAAEQNANNGDLLGASGSPDEVVAELEAKLAAIKAHNAALHKAAGQGIPHAVPVVAPIVPTALPVQAPQYTVGEQPQGGSTPIVVEAQAPSAKIAAAQADYAKRPKKQYKYKYKR